MTRVARALVVTAVLAALAVTLRQLDPVAVRSAFGSMSWWWGAAAATLHQLGIVIDASRWRLIIGARQPVGFWSTCRAHLAGLIGNIFIPFKLGEGARVLMLSRTEALSPATSLTTVLLDRVVDAVLLPVFLGVASLVLPLPATIMRFRPWMLAATIVVTMALLVVGRWIRRRPVVDASLDTGRTIERVVAGLAALGHTRRVVWILLLATASWVNRAAIIWCMILAFHLPLSLTAAVASLAIINLSIAIVATPGNLGTMELATAGALALWGIDPDVGLSLGVAMHALEVIPTILVGLTLGIVPRRPTVLGDAP
jgi:uncharacterized membrane protein YbhN (UPF0104 family)